MAKAQLTTYIENKPVKDVIEWEDVKLMAAFGTDSNQPLIESDRFTFVLDGAQRIINSVAKGDIFDPLEAQLVYRQRNNTQEIFKGFLDTSDGYEELDPTFGSEERPNTVKVKFKADKSISTFLNQIDGVTYGSLFDEGLITDGDFVTIKTVIVKKATFLEIAIALVTIYLLEQQLEETVKEIKKTVGEIISIATGSTIGSAAALVYAVLVVLIQSAFAVALLAILVSLVRDLIELLIPPVVKNKGINFRTLLSKACEKFGYTLVSPIEELDLYNFLPSKPFSDSQSIFDGFLPRNVPTKIGIPAPSDTGYLVSEFFGIIKDLFNTKTDVIGNEVHIRNADDPFWFNQTQFRPHEPIKFPTKRYNTDELFRTRIMSFLLDSNDDWTYENYTGTSFEVITTTLNDSPNASIKGKDQINIPLALPNNKTKLNPLEEVIIKLAGLGDELAKVIGKDSNLANQIEKNRTNVLQISQNEYSVAKIVPIQGGQLPPNHRELLSAKTLITKYYFGKSFVQGEKLGQKVIYENIQLPFNLSDFQKTLKNGTFILTDGRKARFRDIQYQFSKDLAEATIEVQEVYTNKLKETTYEP
jgi:hypothetical protein